MRRPNGVVLATSALLMLAVALPLGLLAGGRLFTPRTAHPLAATAGPAGAEPRSEPLARGGPSGRVRFVRSIATERDIGQRPSLFQRIGRAVFGKAEARLVKPAAVAARGTGKDLVLYVADSGARALSIIAGPDSKSFQTITQAGDQALVSPVGIVATSRAIYLSDSALRQVFVYDLRGRFRGALGKNELERPTGIAYDEESQRLYVADTTAHRIAVYGPNERLERSFGQRGTADGSFNYPTHLSLDRQGYLYVVDSLNHRVQRFDRDGRFVDKFGHHGDGSGAFASPKGIGLDSRDHVYVVDALFDAVQVFDPAGNLLLTVGRRGSEDGQFWLPSGLFIDGKDRIYVADSYNRRIQVFEFLGGQDDLR